MLYGNEALAQRASGMRIHILSDLHNEFAEYVPGSAASEADVVVLAGDIDVGMRGLGWAERAFNCPVLYVPGNHEFYGKHLVSLLDDMRMFSREKTKLLDMGDIIIDGVRFLGATAWTDFAATGNTPVAAYIAQQSLNDFNYIRTDNYRKIHPSDLVQINAQAKSWLRSKIEERYDGKTVVITHHAPLLKSLEDTPYESSHLDSAFANEWPDLMGGEKVALWIHGHSHTAVDYDAYGTRVISNPRGYPGEDTRFNPGLIIEL